MKRYYVYVKYQYYNKDGKPGRKLFQEKNYHSKKMALRFVDKVKKEKTEEFKRYGGKLKNFKYKIKAVDIK